MSEIKRTVEGVALPKSASDVAQQSSGSSATGAVVAAIEGAGGRVGSYRWLIKRGRSVNFGRKAALLVIHLLVPRLEPARIKTS